MKRILIKSILFISSYFPLYIFLLVLNIEKYNSVEKLRNLPSILFLLTMIIATSLSIGSLLFIKFSNSGTKKIKIDNIERPDDTIIVEGESLKTEYSEEEYSKLVLIDQAMKHDLEKIGIKNNEFKKEIENKIIKDFYLIVGEVLDELLKEIADFSLLYYTVIVDIDLCKKGMKKTN